MSLKKKKGDRIAGLDGLRALAIVAVTLFHVYPNVIKGGYLGVALFFVLTGFLLVITTHKKDSNGEFSLFTYFKQRIKRIYPALLIVVLTTLGFYHFFAPDAIKSCRPEVISVLLGYNNWWQIAQKADYFARVSNGSPFTHLWFLSIELQYYLIWPLLYLGLKKLEKRGTVIPVLTGITGFFSLLMPVYYLFNLDITRIYYGTDTRVFSLLAGALTGYLYLRHTKQKWVREKESYALPLLATLLIALIALVAVLFLDGQNRIVYLGGMFVITALFAIQLYLISTNHKVGRMWNIPLFHELAKYSYEIFLWQYPVIYFFQYQGWEFPFHGLLEIALILVLSIMTNYAIYSLSHFKSIEPAAKTGVVVYTCINMVLGAFGAYSIYLSNSGKEEDVVELEGQLTENADLAEQNNSEANIEFNNDKTDYTGSGNSAKVNLDGVVFVGDSVMLDAAPYIYEMFPNAYVDASVSRFPSEEIAILDGLLQNDQVGDSVVIALGTNGTIYPEYAEQTIALLGEHRSIFWVNGFAPDEWTPTNNALLEDLAAKHPNFTVIDWYSLVSANPDWVISDGVHPGPTGAQAYAQLIYDTMQSIAEKQK